MPRFSIVQNYHSETEAGVNKQINLELYASYIYKQLSFHFNRDDVALQGFEKFFNACSKEELKHAEKLLKYQNQRGGQVILYEIPTVKRDWTSGLNAMIAALELEKIVNEALVDLHSVAARHQDIQFADFLRTNYLLIQVEEIRKLGEYVSNLQMMGSELGEYMFNRNMMEYLVD